MENSKEREYQLALKIANDKIKTLEGNISALKNEFSITRENDLIEFDLEKILLSKDYSLPDELDSSVKVLSAKHSIKSELGKLGLVMKRNEAGQIVITDKGGHPAFNDRHDKIEIHSFVDETLTKNQLLKTNDGSQQSSTGTGSNKSNRGGSSQKNAAAMAELDSQLNQLSISTPFDEGYPLVSKK